MSEALAGQVVTVRVLEHRRGPKIDVLRYRPKKRVRVHRGARAEQTALEVVSVGEPPAEEPLTPREREIVRYVAVGMRNAEVAAKLAISEVTVKTHLNNIFQKLHLRGRTAPGHGATQLRVAARDEHRERASSRRGRDSRPGCGRSGSSAGCPTSRVLRR